MVFFLYQPVVCLFVVCVCILCTVYVVFCCKTLQKNQKSNRQHTTLHHCNIIASLLCSSKIALSDCATTVHRHALRCLLDSICCKSLKILRKGTCRQHFPAQHRVNLPVATQFASLHCLLFCTATGVPGRRQSHLLCFIVPTSGAAQQEAILLSLQVCQKFVMIFTLI